MGWEKSSDISQHNVGLREKDIQVLKDFAGVENFKGPGEQTGISKSATLRNLLQDFDTFKKLDELIERLGSLEATFKTMMEPEVIKQLLKSEMEFERGEEMSWEEVKKEL